VQILVRISSIAKIPLEEVVEYVAGNSDAWDFVESPSVDAVSNEVDWDRDIASLDAAILTMLDADADIKSLAEKLDESLKGSLFSRQITGHQSEDQSLIRSILASRAVGIWSQSTAQQRRGFHAAGIGLKAGLFIDSNLRQLVGFMSAIESGIAQNEVEMVAESVLKFAELVFQIAPFTPQKGLPDEWQDALSAWMLGKSSAEVLSVLADEGVDFLQDAVSYRLPWALEAVRVHANAVGVEGSAALTGLAAQAVEAGACNRSVIVLLRAGLNSREAAFAVVRSTDAVFHDKFGLLAWLWSEKLRTLSEQENWPTASSRQAWLRFYKGEESRQNQEWKRVVHKVHVRWDRSPPKAGTHVIVDRSNDQWLVLTPEYERLGVLASPFPFNPKEIVKATVSRHVDKIQLVTFGPVVFRAGWL